MNDTTKEINALTLLIEEVKSYPFKVKKITIDWVELKLDTHRTGFKPKITIEYDDRPK